MWEKLACFEEDSKVNNKYQILQQACKWSSFLYILSFLKAYNFFMIVNLFYEFNTHVKTSFLVLKFDKL